MTKPNQFTTHLSTLSSPSSSPSSILVHIISDINLSLQKEKDTSSSAYEDTLYNLWTAVVSTAKSTMPAEQKKLVDVVLALVRQPSFKRGDGGKVEMKNDGLGMVVREAFNVDELNEKGEQQEFENLNAFLVELTDESIKTKQEKEQVLDFALFGLWMLRDAVEEKASGHVQQYQKDIATRWLGSEAVKQMSKDGRTYDARVAVPGSRFESKDWRGFSKERYDIWTQALHSK